jgi:hypothetical protein
MRGSSLSGAWAIRSTTAKAVSRSIFMRPTLCHARSGATKLVTPLATLIAHGEHFERLRELLPLSRPVKLRRGQIEVRAITTSRNADEGPSTDSSGDDASKPAGSSGGAASRQRDDSNGGGPSKRDDANTDSHASGGASRRVQQSSACFLQPIVQLLAQPGSMALPRARIGPPPLPKRS